MPTKTKSRQLAKKLRKPASKLDPTRTLSLRKKLVGELRKRFRRLRYELRRLVIDEDAFGLVAPTVNEQDWRFRSIHDKLKAFQAWLKQKLAEFFRTKQVEDLWLAYAREGWRKGALRAFDDTRRAEKALQTGTEGVSDFYRGSREQFIRSSFGRPESVDKIKLLAARSYTDLEGVTEEMSTRMSRTLTDGLTQGKNPRDIGRALDKELDLGAARSETIARTEIIRAHAEGALDAFEDLGVEEVGVAVEWSTADDEFVCSRCSALEGVVLKIAEARGMFPLHPRCRCTPVPANVGESTKGQKRTKAAVSEALEDAGLPEAADDLDDERPKSILNAAERAATRDFSTALKSLVKPTPAIPR